jgi:hypothetical protein
LENISSKQEPYLESISWKKNAKPKKKNSKEISDQFWVKTLVIKHFMYHSPPSHLVHLYGVSDKLQMTIDAHKTFQIV